MRAFKTETIKLNDPYFFWKSYRVERKKRCVAVKII